MIFSSTLATAAFLFVLGLVLGSFYNVCIHRYLSGESIVSPSSHCPNCLRRLKWWENLPLASYVLLRGKCRTCGDAISPRYPAVELISGIWLLALYLELGLGAAWAVYLVFGGLLIVLSFVDLESFVLPDVMVLPGAVGALDRQQRGAPDASADQQGRQTVKQQCSQQYHQQGNGKGNGGGRDQSQVQSIKCIDIVGEPGKPLGAGKFVAVKSGGPGQIAE